MQKLEIGIEIKERLIEIGTKIVSPRIGLQ